jgi:methylmalonyl-CoA epimerase
MKRYLKIDHLGIAVPDLKAASATYEVLSGSPATHTEEVEDQRVRVAFFEVGESHFELLEATDPSSPIAKFLERHPRGGLHHVCVEVEDIEAALASYKEAGVRLIDEEPRLGAHNKRVAFVHPASTGGVLLELSESTTSAHEGESEPKA